MSSIFSWRRLLIVTFLLALSLASWATTAREKPSSPRKAVEFKVVFLGVSDKLVLDNIHNSVTVIQQLLNKSFSLPTDDYDWQRLVDTTEQQVREAIKPYGYYLPTIESELDQSASLRMNIELGTPVIASSVKVAVFGMASEITEVKAWQASFPVSKGSVLRQPDYDSAKSSLNKLLARLGFLDAEFVKQEILVNAEKTEANVTLQIESGVRYRYGDILVEWRNEENSSRYDDLFLSRFLTIEPGQLFDSRALQREQNEMSSSPYFSVAEFRPQLEQAKEGLVPVRVVLATPRKFAYGASLGFGTDSGPRSGLSFENRRVNQLGHRFKAELNGSIEKQSFITSYIIPTDGSKRDGLTLFTSYINENSDSRESNTSLIGFDFNRSLSYRTQLSYGLSLRDENFLESDAARDSEILMPSFTWQTVDADDLSSPSRGYRIAATLRGAEDSMGSDISFLQANVNAKGVLSLGAGRFLGRAQIVQTMISATDTLPTSLSFLTGGDHSVRGYGFETIGVENEGGELSSGENLLTASIEYEQSIRGPFALAAFVDAGDAYNEKLDLKVGVGVGARWRLPFGAVRLDLASALDRDGNPLRLHFTFGTDL